jgi:hypothetical protein
MYPYLIGVPSMPESASPPTPVLLISISKIPVPLHPRFHAGHILTAPEALALNQTFAENIRNNMAPKIKKLQEAGELTPEQTAAFVAEAQAYAKTYEFSSSRTSRVVRDPVETEAHKIALNALLASLQRKGKSSKDFTKEALDNAVENLVKTKPQYMELAKQRLAELQQIASAGLEDLL